MLFSNEDFLCTLHSAIQWLFRCYWPFGQTRPMNILHSNTAIIFIAFWSIFLAVCFLHILFFFFFFLAGGVGGGTGEKSTSKSSEDFTFRKLVSYLANKSLQAPCSCLWKGNNQLIWARLKPIYFNRGLVFIPHSAGVMQLLLYEISQVSH